jgi:hypothetical protein
MLNLPVDGLQIRFNDLILCRANACLCIRPENITFCLLSMDGLEIYFVGGDRLWVGCDSERRDQLAGLLEISEAAASQM